MVDLATAFVSIVPSLKGAQREISSQLGRMDMGAAGQTLGRSIGSPMAKSLSQSAQDALRDTTAKFAEQAADATRKIGTAERDLERARADQQTRLAKVAAAEEKLENLRKDAKTSSAELQVAEANLNKAKVDLVDSNIRVSNAEEGLVRAKSASMDASKAYADALARESAALENSAKFSERFRTAALDASEYLKDVGGRFKDVGKRIEGVGRGLTNKITKPALIAGGAVGGLVLGLGFKRLVGLDRAEAQFRGLGYEVEKVMEQVDKGVTNTALSMADGAALAVAALATGNLPLKDLEEQIKRVANVSAAYGLDAEHAGYLLNNVLTKNKVTYGDLSQMVRNQIPIISMLADHYGVTGDEIQKMAQEGKISIEELNEVLDKNAGAAAEEYAKSWDGIRANIVANVGRIGAAFLEGAFPQAKEEMENFLEKLRSPEWTERAREFGEKFAAGLEKFREKVHELIAAWQGLDDETKTWIKRIAIGLIAAGPFLIVVGKIAGVVGTLATGLGTVVGWLGSRGLAGAIGRVLGPVGLIAGALWAVYENSEELQDAVKRLWDALKEAWEKVWPALEPVLSSLAELLGKIAPLIADILVPLVDAMVPIVETIAKVATPILEDLARALEWLSDAMDTEAWGVTWEIVTGTMGGALGTLMTLLQGTSFIMQGDWSGLLNFMRSETERRFPRVTAAFERGGETLKRAIANALDWIERRWGIDLRGMATTATQRWTEIKDGAREKFNELVAFVQTIPAQIRRIFSNSWEWLKQAGRDLIEGFKRGIDERIENVKRTLQNLTSWLPEWKGPPSTDRVILRDAGRLVISGFIDGMESQYRNARQSLTGFTGSLAASGSDFSSGSVSGGALSDADVARIALAVREGSREGASVGTRAGMSDLASGAVLSGVTV